MGDVSTRGFEALKLSIWGGWKALGTGCRVHRVRQHGVVRRSPRSHRTGPRRRRLAAGERFARLSAGAPLGRAAALGSRRRRRPAWPRAWRGSSHPCVSSPIVGSCRSTTIASSGRWRPRSAGGCKTATMTCACWRRTPRAASGSSRRPLRPGGLQHRHTGLAARLRPGGRDAVGARTAPPHAPLGAGRTGPASGRSLAAQAAVAGVGRGGDDLLAVLAAPSAPRAARRPFRRTEYPRLTLALLQSFGRGVYRRELGSTPGRAVPARGLAAPTWRGNNLDGNWRCRSHELKEHPGMHEAADCITVDPSRSAEQAGLTYVTDDEPGITRRRAARLAGERATGGDRAEMITGVWPAPWRNRFAASERMPPITVEHRGFSLAAS